MPKEKLFLPPTVDEQLRKLPRAVPLDPARRAGANFSLGPNGSEDEDDMEGALLLPPDVPYDDLLTLGQDLESADVLPPGYIPPPMGLCHPDDFIYEMNFEQNETAAAS